MDNLSSVMQSTIYLQEGIAAIQLGNSVVAQPLLEQALRLDPKNADAWFWLSGTVTDPKEQRRCLETAVFINPHHTGAQRGLTMLAAREAPRAATPVLAPLPVSVAVGVLQPSSLVGGEITTTHQVPARATPAVAPVEAVSQEAIKAAIQGLGKNMSVDDVCRMLCQKHAIDWGEAQQLVVRLQRRHARTIARRQSPFLFVLSLVSLLTGVIILFYLSISAQTIAADPAHGGRLITSIIRLAPMWVPGLATGIGGIYGVIHTVGSLWAKDSVS